MGTVSGSRIAAICGLILLAGFARPAPRVAAAEQPSDPVLGYSCEESVSGPFGNARLFASLSVDGAISHYLLVWEMPSRREGVWLTGQWALGKTPAAPGENGRILLYFATGDDNVGAVRIEIWRDEVRPLTGMGFHGEYAPVYRSAPGAPYATHGDTRWGELRALLAGIDAATVAVTRHRGLAVMAQDRLNTAVLDMPAAAVAAARDGLAARIADYRNRCGPMRASDGIP